jgi:hypothetical protein
MNCQNVSAVFMYLELQNFILFFCFLCLSLSEVFFLEKLGCAVAYWCEKHEMKSDWKVFKVARVCVFFKGNAY